MAVTFPFPSDVPAQRPSPPTKRTLGNLLQEIGARSPQDIADIERLALMVLARLNEENQWGSWNPPRQAV